MLHVVGGTNSSSSPAHQPTVVRSAVLPTISSRCYELAWALLRHQRRLTGVTMPYRTIGSILLYTSYERSLTDSLIIQLTDTLALTNFRFQFWNPPLCNLFSYVWSLMCSHPSYGRKWKSGEASPPNSRHCKEGNAPMLLFVTNQSNQLVSTSMNESTNQSIS